VIMSITSLRVICIIRTAIIVTITAPSKLSGKANKRESRGCLTRPPTALSAQTRDDRQYSMAFFGALIGTTLSALKNRWVWPPSVEYSGLPTTLTHANSGT
jgi:hypothetical protein